MPPVIFLAVVIGLAWAPHLSSQEEAVADSIRKYRFLAKTASDRTDYSAAIGYYRRYLEYQPEDQRAHYRLGKVHYQNQDVLSARESLGQALRLDSLHVNTNLILFQVLSAQGRIDSAALCLERVLAKRPADNKNRRLLADLYRRANHPRKAIRQYAQLAANLPGEPELAEIVSVLYEEVGEPAAALAWRRRMLENRTEAGGADRDGRRDALEAIARLQESIGDVEAAAAALFELAEVDTVSRYAYYNRIAAIAESAGNTALRLRGLQGMIRANPKDLDSVAMLAEMRLAGGDRGAVRSLVNGGLQIDPEHSRLQLLNGDLLALEGAEEEAIAAFEIARHDPAWERVAQQRIWNLRPPETEEEKLKRKFFGGGDDENGTQGDAD